MKASSDLRRGAILQDFSDPSTVLENHHVDKMAKQTFTAKGISVKLDQSIPTHRKLNNGSLMLTLILAPNIKCCSSYELGKAADDVVGGEVLAAVL